MSRFPVLSTISAILKVLAVVVVVAGFFGGIATANETDPFGRSDFSVARLLVVWVPAFISAVGLWAYAEIIAVILAIEDNTHQSVQTLRELARNDLLRNTQAAIRAIQENTYLAVQELHTLSLAGSLTHAGDPTAPLPGANPSDSSRAGARDRSESAPVVAPASDPRQGQERSPVDRAEPAHSDNAPRSDRRTLPTGLSRPTDPSELTIVRVSQSPNSVSGMNACDRDLSTHWITNGFATPSQAFVSFDLGTIRPIHAIRWMFAETGYADGLLIQVSNDHYDWQTIGDPGRAPADTWQTLAYSTLARSIRFYFENPTNEPLLGYLCDVQILG